MNHVSRRAVLQGSVGASALAFGGLAFAPGSSASTSDPYYPNAGDWRYSVSHYDIAVTVATSANSANHYLSGEVTINAYTATTLTNVQLDTRLAASAAWVDGQAVKITSSSTKATLSGFSVSPGVFTIKVRYAGYPVPVRSDVTDIALSVNAIAFIGEPVCGPYWYPCNDRIDNKATYNITVNTQATQVALGSGKLISSGRFMSSGRSMVTYTFALTEPVSSYMATIQVGPYTIANDSVGAAGVNVPLRFGYSSNAQLNVMRTHTKQALQYFSSLYGPYPFSVSGGVVALGYDRHLWGQETVGSPTYNTGELLGARGPALVAHEHAHMWFGNSVTGATWKDVPLFSEGLAVLLEHDYCVSHGHLASWYTPNASAVASNPGRGEMAWNEAYGVMRALRYRMDGSYDQSSAPNFTAFLRDLATTYRHANVTRSQFKAVAERHASHLGSFWSQYGI